MKLEDKFDWVVDSKQHPFHLPFKEVWRYRDMLYFLAIRDYKIRFKQSALGFLWALIQPLVMITIFYFIFSKSLGVEFEGGPYILFFLCGFIPWNYFSKAISYGSTAFIGEAELIKKVYFPRIILPIATTFSSLSDIIFSFIILVVMLVYYGVSLNPNIVWLPLFFMLMLTYATSLSLWFGTLNVRFRDIQILLPFMIQSLFMLTPLAYPIDKFPESMHWIFIFNPMAGIIEGFRFSILGVGDPWNFFFICSYFFIFFVFLSGLFLFNQLQHKFADII